MRRARRVVRDRVVVIRVGVIFWCGLCLKMCDGGLRCFVYFVGFLNFRCLGCVDVNFFGLCVMGVSMKKA